MGRPKGSKNKKTIQKELKKQTKRAIKKLPIWFLIVILIVTLCVIGYLYYKEYQYNELPKPIEPTNPITADGIVYLSEKEFKADEMTVTFLELLDGNGKGKIGDSVFIEYGNIDILIDAGDKNEGSNTVVPFIKEHVEDNVLELVIVTHADADHMGGMVGLSSSVGALNVEGITYQYLVDFGYIGDTQLYEKYEQLRNELIEQGTKYFSIGSIFDDNNAESAIQFYLGVDAMLEFLDYETYANDDIKDDNDRSVSCLVTHQDKKFLFCGDAEKKEETAITALNLGEVDVFKANHHGSPTSNSAALLNVIKPKYIVISSSEENKYNLPKKVIINRMLGYTENIFATFLSGNIVFTSKNNQITISSTRELIKVQNSIWYLTDDEDNPR